MNTEHDTRRVSEVYRDVANETSPTKLDDRILEMARQEARTRYGLARTWIRPVAWAATIGLSFAFVLEMTYFGDQPGEIDAALPASVDSDAGETARPASQAPASKRLPSTVVAAPEISASSVAEPLEAEERIDSTAADIAEKRQASEPRRERMALERAAAADRCDAEQRQSADTWYRCVTALRDRGLEDAAEAELRDLREAFPDFREPVPE